MDEEPKVSYISKEELICPVCKASFRREELLSGSGRLIAGTITDELHRLYEPSARYGCVYPLIYQATVCPECWFASMDKDFFQLPAFARDIVLRDREQRRAQTNRIFPEVDFHENRTLVSGAASLYLVILGYDYFSKEVSPTIKQGIASLRTGWLCDELHEKKPGEHYDWLALLFKKKARFFYAEALNREQNGSETFEGIKNFGPDTDKNYAYEGMLYLSAILNFKFGPREDSAQRRTYLGEAKRIIARIFGLGKSSKAKPGPLLEHARNVYDAISKELNEIDE
ncbi:MAG: DUF2225 domain-containing protein [Spirochaetaceae bacterium]|jgi:uncharacterized protein (DUF2225 family)|nr:DUF2225 domain-containing protein [Spirochaetaceae bacterium]